MKTNYVMVMLRLLNYASDKFIQKLLRLHTLGVMELCDIQYITQNTGFFFSNHSDYIWCTNMVRNNFVSCIILSNPSNAENSFHIFWQNISPKAKENNLHI